MKSAWLSSLDQFWHSPALPMWVTLAAAVFFALVLLATLLRAEKSVANGALTVITFLAVAIAVAATVRGFRGVNLGGKADQRPLSQMAALPALSCLDGLAGDAVEAACERALFVSAESTAAAVSYTAAQITRLSGFGNLATANAAAIPELPALRHTLERDRYGLVANVLRVRDGCTPTDCDVFKSLADPKQIAANMIDRTYESLIGRYALSWNNPATTAAGANPGVAGSAMTGSAAAISPSMTPQASIPTGKPVSGDFPSSASIPPVSIMTSEPPAAASASGSAPKAGNATNQQTSHAAPPSPAAKKPPPKRTAASPAAPPPSPQPAEEAN